MSRRLRAHPRPLLAVALGGLLLAVLLGVLPAAGRSVGPLRTTAGRGAADRSRGHQAALAHRAGNRPAGRLLYPLPAGPVAPEPCPPPPWHGPLPSPVPFSRPAVPDRALPPPLAVRERAVDLGAVSGKGIWLTSWPQTRLDPAAVVRRAVAAGLRQLWVRTGGSLQGYYGDRLLRALLPAAHRAGVAVVAWDFPMLSDPVGDARRAARALGYSVAGQRIDAFAADIETPAEGVHLTGRRVAVYLSRVRRAAAGRPLVATVPWPTRSRVASYPYRVEARYVDAFAPMDYWSCAEPGSLVRRSIAVLGRLRPVTPIGQSYDMGPEGGRPGLPTGREIWRFLDTARRLGAVGASLYTWETTGPRQWRALAGYPW